MKVLESIDRIIDGRRQEREKEKILKAATSRSKQDNPELAKKKEQAKQVKESFVVVKKIMFVYVRKFMALKLEYIHQKSSKDASLLGAFMETQIRACNLFEVQSSILLLCVLYQY